MYYTKTKAFPSGAQSKSREFLDSMLVVRFQHNHELQAVQEIEGTLVS